MEAFINVENGFYIDALKPIIGVGEPPTYRMQYTPSVGRRHLWSTVGWLNSVVEHATFICEGHVKF